MFGAVIFDFDGVIADDELLHLAGFRLALESHGISISEADYFKRYVGFNDQDGFAAILTDNQRQADPETVWALMGDKASIFKDLVGERVRIFPGVRELLDQLVHVVAPGRAQRQHHAMCMVRREHEHGACFNDVTHLRRLVTHDKQLGIPFA